MLATEGVNFKFIWRGAIIVPFEVNEVLVRELACTLFDSIPAVLPRFRPYSIEERENRALDSSLASLNALETGGYELCYNPNGDYTQLPGIAKDYKAFKASPKWELHPLTMNEYAFHVTLLHELGHWKQTQTGITMDSVGRALCEYHNILMHENLFFSRQRLSYRPLTIIRAEMQRIWGSHITGQKKKAISAICQIGERKESFAPLFEALRDKLSGKRQDVVKEILGKLSNSSDLYSEADKGKILSTVMLEMCIGDDHATILDALSSLEESQRTQLTGGIATAAAAAAEPTEIRVGAITELATVEAIPSPPPLPIVKRKNPQIAMPSEPIPFPEFFGSDFISSQPNPKEKKTQEAPF